MAVTAVGLAGFCAIAVGPADALGQQSANDPSIGEQVGEAADDLANANAKVSKVITALSAAQEKLDAAQEQLDAAAARGAEAEQTAARALAAVKVAERAVSALESQIETIQQRVTKLRAEVGQLARLIYMSGGQFDEIQMVLEAKDPAEFAERLAAIRLVSRGNDRVLDRLAAAKFEMDQLLAKGQKLEERAQARRDEADRKSAEAKQATDEAASARQLVAELVANRKVIVSSANSERDVVKAQYAELRSEQERIAASIRAAVERERLAELARLAEEERIRREAAKKPKPVAPPSPVGPPSAPGVVTPTPAPPPPPRPAPSNGQLSWPVPGYSAGGKTGPRVHPIYGYRSCHTGIDIGAGYGVPIRSAAPGYVVSTNTGGPYGYHTVIYHGGGLSTMYAHQSSFAVSEGRAVARGQVIGYVGSTGYSTGPHLHFEVHVNGVPYEPMGWFGWNKYRVTCY